MRGKKTIVALAVACAATGAGSVAAFRYFEVHTDGGAALRCPNGMTRLGHVFDESASTFPGDPETIIELATTIESDGFLVEAMQFGTHTSTHIDSPGHFIEGGRTIDDLAATDFVWRAYVIDIRDRMTGTDADGFQLTPADIRAYERRHGRIPSGAMVIIQTGFEEYFGTDAYFGAAPGFSGDTVQWLVDHRRIDGIGSDTFGPDATSDPDFAATFTILDNDRVAMPGLDNLDSLSISNDIIIASAIQLRDGSGFQTDPLACHGRRDR